jgi:hypothetical protein
VQIALVRGILVSLNFDDTKPAGSFLTMAMLNQAMDPPGPGVRWLTHNLNPRLTLDPTN